MDNIHFRPRNGQTVALSTTSASSQPINDPRVKVRVVCSVDAWVTVSNPAAPAVVGAAGTSTFMPAGVIEYFHICPGDIVSGIVDGNNNTVTSGYLNVSEMGR